MVLKGELTVCYVRNKCLDFLSKGAGQRWMLCSSIKIQVSFHQALGLCKVQSWPCCRLLPYGLHLRTQNELALLILLAALIWWAVRLSVFPGGPDWKEEIRFRKTDEVLRRSQKILRDSCSSFAVQQIRFFPEGRHPLLCLLLNKLWWQSPPCLLGVLEGVEMWKESRWLLLYLL